MMPKKALGQHFLFDPRILARIVDALSPQAGETVLEIGPGRGTLTAHLVGRTGRLVAIEKDRDLINSLKQKFPTVEIVEADALEVDWHALVGIYPFAVIGNIPYNITSPLIDKALTPPRPARVVFLVQKEVAERVAAAPGGSEYGALSVGVQSVARVERLFTVPAGAFSPPPKIDSAVLRLTPLASPLIPDGQIAEFRRMVVGLFGFRRKQLIRGVRELTGISAEQARAVLSQAGVTGTKRPQELSPADFVRLHQVIRAESRIGF
jgi:16S rRNA (adenine1518-N6/adenine1519-N6)-dimethyltransferase